jgi:hypothetical protein
MKDVIFDEFQDKVNESLLRHKSILDILTKFQESNARVNRAVVKSVTNCGCMKINASKQQIPCDDDNIESLNDCMKTHLEGVPCDGCREIIEREIGNSMFYLTALCNLLDVSLYDAMIKEQDKMNTLGKYTFR